MVIIDGNNNCAIIKYENENQEWIANPNLIDKFRKVGQYLEKLIFKLIETLKIVIKVHIHKMNYQLLIIELFQQVSSMFQNIWKTILRWIYFMKR